MKRYVSLGLVVISLILLTALLVLPVSGVGATAVVVTTSPESAGVTVVPTETIAKAAPAGTLASSAKPVISATVSTTTPTVGDSITISGVATGGNLTSGVQIWVFAGNYVNVTNVPVNADGTFSKTYTTMGLPPATYYVFVQSPGPNGIVDIDLIDAGVYSGQVVNTLTNALIFNFTGAGSVQDAAASKALSEALNLPEQDDVYTKLTFQLTSPVTAIMATETTVAAPATPAIPAASTSAKSPLAVEVTAGALVISGCCAVLYKRKIQ